MRPDASAAKQGPEPGLMPAVCPARHPLRLFLLRSPLHGDPTRTSDLRELAGRMSGQGAGVTQALSFLGKEASPNLRLALVTKACLSPPPAVSPSLQEAARPCLARLPLPSVISVCSGSSHSLILARGPRGVKCISSTCSVALKFLVQCHGPELSAIVFIPSANICGARHWETLGPNQEVALPLWS